MIIPLIEDRNFGEESLHFFVTVIVLPVGPELVESDSNKVLRWVVIPRAEILSAAAIGHIFCGRDRTISVDHITYTRAEYDATDTKSK